MATGDWHMIEQMRRARAEQEQREQYQQWWDWCNGIRPLSDWERNHGYRKPTDFNFNQLSYEWSTKDSRIIPPADITPPRLVDIVVTEDDLIRPEPVKFLEGERLENYVNEMVQELDRKIYEAMAVPEEIMNPDLNDVTYDPYGDNANYNFEISGSDLTWYEGSQQVLEIAQSNLNPSASITITNADNSSQITIDADSGTVDLGDMTLEDGAALFWDTVENMGMGRIATQAALIKELRATQASAFETIGELEKEIKTLRAQRNMALETGEVYYNKIRALGDEESFDRAMSLLD